MNHTCNTSESPRSGRDAESPAHLPIRTRRAIFPHRAPQDTAVAPATSPESFDDMVSPPLVRSSVPCRTTCPARPVGCRSPVMPLGGIHEPGRPTDLASSRASGEANENRTVDQGTRSKLAVLLRIPTVHTCGPGEKTGKTVGRFELSRTNAAVGFLPATACWSATTAPN